MAWASLGGTVLPAAHLPSGRRHLDLATSFAAIVAFKSGEQSKPARRTGLRTGKCNCSELPALRADYGPPHGKEWG